MAVLEGFHALKHALRFGATIEESVTRDLTDLRALARDLAPDVVDVAGPSVREVSAAVFEQLATSPPDTGVISIARRRHMMSDIILGEEGRTAPVVLLERPAHRGNVGAVIRASASASARAVITTGPLDPWDPAVIRGSAGLHFAIDVVRAEELGDIRGPLIAVDPEGEALAFGAIPSNAVLAFGSERNGLSAVLRARASTTIGIPMQTGVSSMNLATSVAVVLYAWRLAQ